MRRQFFRKRRLILFVLALILLISALYVGWRVVRRLGYSPTLSQLEAFFSDPSTQAALVTDLNAPCLHAPFLLPSRGFVGFLYADPTAPYDLFRPHPGVDIFGVGEPGTVPIFAAHDGYLTRLPGWIGSVIIRIPHDPLDASRQIWTYYTHMADLSGQRSFVSHDFPAGTSEIFVKQGTLLGYQGEYAGAGASPIRMHLHFSVVLSDASGSFRNETRIENTLDPSPYLGLTLNATKNPTIPVHCGA